MRSTIMYLMCVLVTVSVIEAAPLVLTATPMHAAAGITLDITVDCRLPEEVKDAKIIFYLALSHEAVNGTEEQIAELSAASGLISLVEGNRTSVDGHLSKDGEDAASFVTFTVLDPEEEDGGIYRCMFIYLTNDLEAKNLAAAVNVTVAVIPEAIEYFVPQVAQPVHTGCACDKIWEEINNLKATIVADNAQLKSQIESFDDSCRVSFAAKIGADSVMRISNDVQVAFNDVISNNGGAYNVEDGDFVAPCAGQYHFGLTLRAYQAMDNGYVAGVIKRDGKPEARTAVFNAIMDDHYNSASTAVVLTLAKGEKVNVVLDSTTSGRIMNKDNSIFSGFFLHP